MIEPIDITPGWIISGLLAVLIWIIQRYVSKNDKILTNLENDNHDNKRILAVHDEKIESLEEDIQNLNGKPRVKYR